MRPDHRIASLAFGLLAILTFGAAIGATVAAQSIITESTEISVDVSPANGRLAIELDGGIWLLARTGGPATLLAKTTLPARQPRWSPDGESIVFQSSAGNVSTLWRVDIESGELSRVNTDDFRDVDASWHPNGDKILFSSERRGTGIDLWETDLRTGLTWRISNHPGDETQAAWSADGRDLAYIRQGDQRWSLMLRRFGEPDSELVHSTNRLSAPAWRPDGTLITYLEDTERGPSLQMAILSNPPLLRQLAPPDAFVSQPVSWLDRDRFYYAASGRIKTRRFDEWSGRTVAFRATVDAPTVEPGIQIANRSLPIVSPAAESLVIRSDRIFDGLSHNYRNAIDVRIEGGLVAEVSPHRDWGDVPVIHLRGSTMLPGLIDTYAALPDDNLSAAGASLLSWGITTIVSPDQPAGDPGLWEGETYPGPRYLPARAVTSDDGSPAPVDDDVFLWTLAEPADGSNGGASPSAALRQLGRPVLAVGGPTSIRLGTGLLLGTDLLPRLPRNTQAQLAVPPPTRPGVTLVSGLAAPSDPLLLPLFDARQARGLAGRYRQRRMSDPRSPLRPNLRGIGSQLVAGSRPGQLPSGLALHAELRSMAASGMPHDQVLMSAGAHGARVLGLTGLLGVISPGATADLLLVSGDPLQDVDDLVNIVAIVRNGRFYSLVALLERATATVD